MNQFDEAVGNEDAPAEDQVARNAEVQAHHGSISRQLEKSYAEILKQNEEKHTNP